MSDDDIDYSDIPAVRDFSGWKRGRFYEPPDGQVMLPIDRELAIWFRETDDDYLAAINAVLREHMERRCTSS